MKSKSIPPLSSQSVRLWKCSSSWLANAVGLLRGAPVEPVALHRMHHAHAHHGLAPGQRGVQAGEVILYVGVIAATRGTGS